LTTLAIIGGGIAGRSLIYTLAKKKNSFSQVVLFDSDVFAQTCSIRSTAIVAPRGISSGLSALGDQLIKGFDTFHTHVKEMSPAGVFTIKQFSAASFKLDQFKKRYPNGKMVQHVHGFSLEQEMYMHEESAFLVDTQLYLQWLTEQASSLPLSLKNDFIISCEQSDQKVELKNNLGDVFVFDQVVFTGGIYNRLWGQSKAGKSAQGSYFEFLNCELGLESFSLTLDGDNLIYHAHSKKLLIGSTTKDASHHLPDLNDLNDIYKRLKTKLRLSLPEIDKAKMMTGIREKAAQRRPYLIQDGKICWFGGLYKNGFSLSLHLANDLVHLI
jgi:hypothetical protein